MQVLYGEEEEVLMALCSGSVRRGGGGPDGPEPRPSHPAHLAGEGGILAWRKKIKITVLNK